MGVTGQHIIIMPMPAMGPVQASRPVQAMGPRQVTGVRVRMIGIGLRGVAAGRGLGGCVGSTGHKKSPVALGRRAGAL